MDNYEESDGFIGMVATTITDAVSTVLLRKTDGSGFTLPENSPDDADDQVIESIRLFEYDVFYPKIKRILKKHDIKSIKVLFDDISLAAIAADVRDTIVSVVLASPFRPTNAREFETRTSIDIDRATNKVLSSYVVAVHATRKNQAA